MSSGDAPASPVLLVDGDIIRYRCAFAAEKTEYAVVRHGELLGVCDSHAEIRQVWPEVDESYVVFSRKIVQPVEFALQCAKTTLEALKERFKPEVIQIYLTGPGNFRDSLAVTKPYKGNRLEAKPKHYNAVAEYLTGQWGAAFVRGYEADDAIGVELSHNPEGAISVSTDKDLDQIAGWHFDWVAANLYRVSRREADFALYTQILAGDATDNVVGVPGIGEAKARKILEGAKNRTELCERAWTTYKDHGLSREYFIEQANLVYIWREWGDTWNSDQALKLE